MKKLFIPLLITMTGLAVNSALAQSTAPITKPSSGGFVTVNGQTGTALDAATTEGYLTDICGISGTPGTTTGWTYNSTGPTTDGEVFFVEINDYWCGMRTQYNNYTQINKGVKKISTVNSSQDTSTGTFYTYPAKNVNKFFFIKKRSRRRSGNDTFAFRWYDEWSYVTDPNGVNGPEGYDALEPTWEKLMDGTPFPSPHNCNSSLENNHYIALDGEHPLDSKGHDFTAYLYIPNECADGTEPNTTNVEVGTGEYEYVSNGTTYYIYDKEGGFNIGIGTIDKAKSTSELADIYTLVNGEYITIADAYKDKFYRTHNRNSDTPIAEVKGYVKQEIKETQVSGICPYVFFYAVDLQDVPDNHVTIKTGKPAEGKSKYQVELHWNTAFDKFANHGVQKTTEYDGMQEHYVIQRSYDNKNWETVDDKLIVSGNDVKDAANKTIIDTGLDDKDSEFGFTVWYCVTSIVEKSDGTDMSTTTSNVVRVEIPGTVPFKLTLGGEGTSVYDPVNEKNTFTNTIISSDSKVEYETIVKAGSTLSLYRVDADGKIIEDDESPLITVTAEGGETLADLAKQIKSEGNPEGKYTDACTLPAGDENEAAYQLVMKIPANDENSTATYVYSNILRISNPAIANASIAAHRSGYPDAETCQQNGNPEIFHNEITFKASANRVGTGYYIYRRYNKEAPEMIMTLIYNGEDGFRVDGSTDNTPIKPDPTTGKITIIDIVDTAPIAEGEGVESIKSGESVKSATEVAWSYAVAYSDNVGYEDKENTYGSQSKPAVYEGTNGELVLGVEADIKAANFSQPGNNKIYTVVTINWYRTKEYDDTKPISYEIYVKKNGKDRTDITDPKFIKEETIGAEANITTYTFTDTYESVWQGEHGKYDKNEATKAEFANSLKDAYEVYVKMITTEGKEKNSFIAIPKPQAGAIYTGIEGVEAQEMDVKVVNGVVEVNGVYGMIKVIDAKGAVAAEAVGTGDVTEIEGLGTGVYVVTAKDMKPTKILIK